MAGKSRRDVQPRTHVSHLSINVGHLPPVAANTRTAGVGIWVQLVDAAKVRKRYEGELVLHKHVALRQRACIRRREYGAVVRGAADNHGDFDELAIVKGCIRQIPNQVAINDRVVHIQGPGCRARERNVIVDVLEFYRGLVAQAGHGIAAYAAQANGEIVELPLRFVDCVHRGERDRVGSCCVEETVIASTKGGEM